LSLERYFAPDEAVSEAEVDAVFDDEAEADLEVSAALPVAEVACEPLGDDPPVLPPVGAVDPPPDGGPAGVEGVDDVGDGLVGGVVGVVAGGFVVGFVVGGVVGFVVGVLDGAGVADGLL
jgi:hypothetical protein